LRSAGRRTCWAGWANSTCARTLGATVLLTCTLTATSCAAVRSIKEMARGIEHLSETTNKELPAISSSIQAAADAVRKDADSRKTATDSVGEIIDRWKEALGLLGFLVVFLLRKKLAMWLGGVEHREAVKAARAGKK